MSFSNRCFFTKATLAKMPIVSWQNFLRRISSPWLQPFAHRHRRPLEAFGMWVKPWILLFLPGVAAVCKSCQTKGFYMLQHRHVHKSTAHLKKTPCDTVVDKHGFLKVIGNKVTSESGEPVRLRGMSLFWSQWKPQFWTKGTTEWLQKDWGVSLIRAAMAVESGGYLTNKRAEIKKVKTVVDAAIDVGIYVTRHQTWAFLFFQECGMCGVQTSGSMDGHGKNMFVRPGCTLGNGYMW